MSQSPSRYRREGRKSFYPGGNMTQSCPYVTDSYNARWWHEGWREAEKAYVPPEPEYGGYLAAMREDHTDAAINNMSNVELLAAIDAIDERNVKGF